MVWYAHLFQNSPQFIVIHTVKGFGIVNKAEIDVFLELSCFFDDSADVGNLVSGSSKLLQSFPTLYDPTDGSPPGSPVPEILQARTLEWVAISFSITTTLEIAKELNIDHSTVIWHLKQIEKVKKLDKWVPHDLTGNQKYHLNYCLLLFYATTMNHFLIRL